MEVSDLEISYLLSLMAVRLDQRISHCAPVCERSDLFLTSLLRNLWKPVKEKKKDTEFLETNKRY